MEPRTKAIASNHLFSFPSNQNRKEATCSKSYLDEVFPSSKPCLPNNPAAGNAKDKSGQFAVKAISQISIIPFLKSNCETYKRTIITSQQLQTPNLKLRTPANLLAENLIIFFRFTGSHS
jgi:hypothetical protein